MGEAWTHQEIEERAAYYEVWASDIRRLNGTSVDADHADKTARLLRTLASQIATTVTALENIVWATPEKTALSAEELVEVMRATARAALAKACTTPPVAATDNEGGEQ